MLYVPTKMLLSASIRMHYNWSLFQAIEDLDLSVQGFYNYGKGFIKTCKVKAFIMPCQTLFVVGTWFTQA